MIFCFRDNMSNTADGYSKASKTQADIREVMSRIQQKAQNQRNVKQAKPAAVEPQATRPKSPNVQAANTLSSFAREIFLTRTNIGHLIEERYPHCSENTRLHKQENLFKAYVESPIMRISDPLEKLRFETRYWQGLFCMATKLPLRDNEDFGALKQTLSRAGVKKMCFVDMTQNNLVLQDQRYVLHLLKSKFANWSGKLKKLTYYLQDCQKIRENKKTTLKQLIKEHGNIPWNKIAVIQDRFISELLSPPENRRGLFLLQGFAFDDDRLNKKYYVGRHFKVSAHMKTLLENIPELPERPPKTYAPAQTVRMKSPPRSVSEPLATLSLDEVNFSPYDSSTQTMANVSSRRRSLSQANANSEQEPPAKRRTLTERSLEIALEVDLPAATPQDHQHAVPHAVANADAHEDHRNSQSQTEARAVVQQTRPKNSVAFPRVRSVRPQSIVYEGDIPPEAEKVIVGIDTVELADQNRSVGPIVDPLHLTQFANSTRMQNRNSQQMPSSQQYSDDDSNHQHNTTQIFTPFNSSTQKQDVNSHQVPSDLPANASPSSGAIENQQNTPVVVDTLLETDTLSFKPPVSSTQTAISQQEQEAVPPEENVPFALENTSSPLATPIADTINEPSCLLAPKPEEHCEELDSSGYEGYVEEVHCPTQIHYIPDTEEQLLKELVAPASNPVAKRLAWLFAQNTPIDLTEQEPDELIPADGESGARAGEIQSYEHQMVTFMKDWKTLFADKHRARQRSSVQNVNYFKLDKVQVKSTVHPVQPFDFLIVTNIESIRYTEHPIRWRGCNELQQNLLTVNLYHCTSGIFTVSVHDRQVGHLFGLLGPTLTTSVGWEALTASLAFVGKFRYGRKEPMVDYHRMPVTEKVLYLYFDTIPSFPRYGGFVLGLGQKRNSFPANGGIVTIQRFNVNVHLKQKRVTHECNNPNQRADENQDLENLLLPGVAEAMQKIYERIFAH